MACRMCAARGQPWEGSPPVCAFAGERFSAGNWNCATVNAIRDLAEAAHVYCDDQYYAVLRVADVADGRLGLALYVSWYKHRGRTDALWLLGGTGPPIRPTEADCRAILEARGVTT